MNGCVHTRVIPLQATIQTVGTFIYLKATVPKILVQKLWLFFAHLRASQSTDLCKTVESFYTIQKPFSWKLKKAKDERLWRQSVARSSSSSSLSALMDIISIARLMRILRGTNQAPYVNRIPAPISINHVQRFGTNCKFSIK